MAKRKRTSSALASLSFSKLNAELVKRETRLKDLEKKRKALQGRMDRLDAKIDRLS